MVGGISGLIIKDPYISYILEGAKTWEMRSSNTRIRGPIALIKKGSGMVWGVANLVDVKGPLSLEEMFRNQDKHRIAENRLRSGETAKWNYAWVLENVTSLPRPVPYEHRSGAVIWVTLTEEVASRIFAHAKGVSAVSATSDGGFSAPPAKSAGTLSR